MRVCARAKLLYKWIKRSITPAISAVVFPHNLNDQRSIGVNLRISQNQPVYREEERDVVAFRIVIAGFLKHGSAPRLFDRAAKSHSHPVMFMNNGLRFLKSAQAHAVDPAVLIGEDA